MKIYILRHGIAVERGSGGYTDDSKRPLTVKGREKMHDIARNMRQQGIRFDLLLSSPYVRARETIEIVTKEFNIKKNAIVYSNNLIPDAPIKKIVEEINTTYPSSKSILIAGHEPHLSSLISYLLAGHESAIAINLKKGGLCQLDIEKLKNGACAVLTLLLNPSH